jgi:hypothetical protein
LNPLTAEHVTQETRKPTEIAATAHALRFVRSRWLFILALSALLLTPCYWHRRIEAGDLGSHTYNAWLAHLVAQGQAPGLHTSPQYYNVLVDLALTWLGSGLGFITAERIVVSVCVLCFFWGAFAFIAASTQRAPWFIVPAIAIISYGYTFYAGFMNYYLSLGLAFAAAALFWRGTRADWILGVVLAIVTFLAHPGGFGVLLALVVYIRLAEMARGWQRWVLFASALLALGGLHFYLLTLKTLPGLGWRGLLLTGADQLLIFGHHYKPIAALVLAFGSLCFCVAAIQDRKEFAPLRRVWTPLTLWALLLVSAAILPGVIWLPQFAFPVGSTSSRLSTVTAILGLCVLGSVRPRKWILAGLVVCAAIFFGLQYYDTGVLNGMEQQAETLVAGLPYGWHVSYTLYLSEDPRVNFRHFVDRACIGKCFAYSNYEPRSGQFRVRVSPGGSPLVSDSGLAMELGEYVVRDADLPMAQIYQSDEADLTKLAIRELKAGEKNGRVGHHPPASEIESRLPNRAK